METADQRVVQPTSESLEGAVRPTWSGSWLAVAVQDVGIGVQAVGPHDRSGVRVDANSESMSMRAQCSAY